MKKISELCGSAGVPYAPYAAPQAASSESTAIYSAANAAACLYGVVTEAQPVWAAGFAAFRLGSGVKACPFKPDGAPGKVWMAGWGKAFALAKPQSQGQVPEPRIMGTTVQGFTATHHAPKAEP